MASFSIKNFPWSPGLSWKIKNGKYVVPELPFELFSKSLKNKDLVICSFGGLVESFYSLSVLELLNNNLIGNKLYWVGNPEYQNLLKLNGLAKYFNKITAQDLENFPTPIFFDKNNRAYINCLLNYQIKKAYYSSTGYPDNRPIIQQIVEKSTIPWEDRYLPQLRNTLDLNNFQKIHKLNFENKTLLIVPDSISSIHPVNCIDWNVHQVKSMIAIAHQLGYQVVLLTLHPEYYWGTLAKVVKFSAELYCSLVPRIKNIISKNVDCLLIALSLNNCNIFTDELPKHLLLDKNNVFVGSDSDIYTIKNIQPMDVLEKLKE